MTPNEYVKFALITESNQFSSQTILGKLSMKFFKWANAGTLSDRFTQRRNIRLIHSSIGIATEMEEVLSMLDNSLNLDCVNLLEEVADCLWYCAIAVDELEIDFDRLVGTTKFHNWNLDDTARRKQIESQTRATIKASGRFLDLIKKSAFYGKPLDKQAVELCLMSIVSHLSANCHLAGFPVETAMKRNIAKLAERYHSKFSSHEAYNRNLEAERKILEGRND